MHYSASAQAVFSVLPVPLPKVQNLDFESELKIFQNSQNSLVTARVFNRNPGNVNNFSDHFLDKNEDDSSSPQVPNSLVCSSQSIEFKLVLGNNIENPLCKCKYFCFKIYLKPVQEVLFPREEKVQLKVCVYRSDGQRIMRNMKGGNILKGNFLQNLSFFNAEGEHYAFFRIQVTEVSSYYTGKTVSLEIKPKTSDFLRRTQWRIHPLKLENISIKAKTL